MIEQLIQRLIEHPRGQIYVILGSLALALVLIVPVADEYSDLTDNRDALSRKLATTRKLTKNTANLEQRITAELARLAEYEQQMVTADTMPSFRGQVVDVIRESGCQLRKITVGGHIQRTWGKKDHPLSSRDVRKKVNPKDQSGYDLGSQSVVLTVSGSLLEIRQFLARLHEHRYLSHTRSFVLRPENRSQNTVLLELELLLFSLETSNEKAV